MPSFCLLVVIKIMLSISRLIKIAHKRLTFGNAMESTHYFHLQGLGGLEMINGT